MKKIIYTFNDGTTNEVEVSDEMYALYEDLESAEKKTNRKETRRHQSLERSMDAGWDVADDTDIVALLEKKELTESLRAAIATLSPGQRELIHKVFFERIPQVEIAKNENVSAVAIHSRLQRALARLQKFFTIDR